MWKRLAAVAALPLLLAACGGASSTGATHVMSDGSTMSGSSMAGMPGMTSSPGLTAQHGGQGGGTPSASASMICGSEIRDAVRHNLDLSRTPVGLHAWQHRTFSCTYQLAGGELRLSVKDLDTAGPGRAYFDHLRSRLPAPQRIRGLEAFGLPAVETAHGDVVFLKDDKTLWVDASRLKASDLPTGRSREDVAYGVASAVVACWSE
jgi:hypothetical protein